MYESNLASHLLFAVERAAFFCQTSDDVRRLHSEFEASWRGWSSEVRLAFMDKYREVDELLFTAERVMA